MKNRIKKFIVIIRNVFANFPAGRGRVGELDEWETKANITWELVQHNWTAFTIIPRAAVIVNRQWCSNCIRLWWDWCCLIKKTQFWSEKISSHSQFSKYLECYYECWRHERSIEIFSTKDLPSTAFFEYCQLYEFQSPLHFDLWSEYSVRSYLSLLRKIPSVGASKLLYSVHYWSISLLAWRQRRLFPCFYAYAVTYLW